MKDTIRTREVGGHGITAGGIRSLGWGLMIALLAGCRPPPSPEPEPPLLQPADFATWPRVTAKPLLVSREMSMMCSIQPGHGGPTDQYGPHYNAYIVVRVSPEAEEAYRAGRPLPAGAVVVKEKHRTATASQTPDDYALMIKRAAGYDRRGGDWEYGYVSLDDEPRVARGRLKQCSECHVSARRTDYLFRSYGAADR